MKQAFDLLASHGVLRRGKIRRDAVSSMKFDRLVNLASAIANLSRELEALRPVAGMSHCATVALSGGPDPCTHLQCRLQQVDELARFACVLSDRVYTYNYFATYLDPHEPAADTPLFREGVYNDFVVLMALRPLIESGLVVPFTPKTSCPHCLVRHHLGPRMHGRIKRATAALEREFYQKFTFDLQAEDGEYIAHYDGPEDYSVHGGGVMRLNDDIAKPALAKMPLIRRRVDKGELVRLSVTARKKLILDRQLALDLTRDIGFEMALSKSLDAAFVTNLPRQVELLKSLNRDDGTANMGTRQLEAAVPFLGDVSVSQMLKLRDREAASFVHFRAALARASLEMRDSAETFTDKHARSLYSDVVAPKLAQLDRAVSLAKKQAGDEMAPQLIIASTVAIVSIGLYLGISAPELLAVAKALGLGALGASTTGGITSAVAGGYKRRTAERRIQSEDFYYLWKLRQLSKK